MENGLLVLGRQHVLPGRHGRTGLPLSDGAEQFCIRFDSGRRRDEIARSRGKKRGLDPVALAGCAMALHAMRTVDGLPVVERF